MGADITDFIREHSLDTDIFCFQEAYDEMMLICKDILTDYTKITASKFVANVHEFSQATYIRKGLALLSSEILLQNQRGCGLGIYTHIQYQNKSVHICNVHGISQPGDKLDNQGRLKQSSMLIDFLKDKEGTKIIGGDFNLLPHTKSVGLFEENGYRNLIKEYAISTTRNPLSFAMYPNDKQYYADYVFLNQDVRETYFSVPKNEISDHLPLIVEI